jgi:hypothetical protein
MSHWKRLSRKHRALYLTIAVLALAATALASGRLMPDRNATTTPFSSSAPDEPSNDVRLGGTLPPPTDVFIQKTDSFPKLGNVLVMVRLSPAQVAAKKGDGTETFVTIGDLGEVLFRDDGQGGDAAGGDALYTAVARVDLEELARRAELDQAALHAGSSKAPVFSGRALAGSRTQQAFDFGGFQAGDAVRLDPAVVNVQVPVSPWPPTNPPNQFQERALMIRDPGAVADPTRTIDPCTLAGTPGGSWTFEHLMKEMANQPATGLNPSVFTENWLQNWTANQTINAFGVPSRLQMQNLINQWRAASGGGNLDLSKAPVRLLAIVSRLDLRRTRGGGGGYGGHGGGAFLDAGEARFIFGFVLPAGWRLAGGYNSTNAPLLNRNGCRALPFTVIFEYRVPKSDCPGVRDWAQRWVDLANFVPGTPDFNDRLELLTEEFVTANANPTRPNGSALGQLRTNEIALAAPWQLREFQLTQFPSSLLDETTTNDTADDSFNNTTVFQSWILGQISPLLSSPWDQAIPTVPLVFPSSNFQGAHPEVPGPGFFWNAPGLNLSPFFGDNSENWGRHRASLTSCNGCHAGETSTNFVHVDPSTPGLPANLSGFLTGITVADPAEASGLPNRTFSDLARREQDLQDLARISCLRFAPVDVALVHDSLVKTGRIPADPFPTTLSPDQFRSVAVDDMKANHITEVH